MRCFTLHARKTQDKSPYDTIPSWLLMCMYYLPKCKCPMYLKLNILCVLDTPPTTKLHSTPNPNLNIQILKFTYCNDKFLMKATSHKLNQYTNPRSILSQHIWTVFLPIIITTRIKRTVHILIVKHRRELEILTSQIHRLMENLHKLQSTTSYTSFLTKEN